MSRLASGWSRLAILCVVACVAGLGCSIKFQHGELDPPAIEQERGTLNHSKDAEKLDRRVGWGRFTVFAIPLVPIYVVGDDGQEFMLQVRDALEVAGYEPVAIEPGEPAEGPVLHCYFGETSFSNYTWLFPIVPTWGSITVTAQLVDADGTSLWTREFRGGGSTLNLFNGYTSSAKRSVTEILNAMIESLVADDFQLALSNTKSRSSESGAVAEVSPPTDSSGRPGADDLPAVSSQPLDDTQTSPPPDSPEWSTSEPRIRMRVPGGPYGRLQELAAEAARTPRGPWNQQVGTSVAVVV